MFHKSLALAIVILLTTIAGAPSLAVEAPPTSIQTPWKRARWHILDPLTVTISEPLVIARSHDRLWFPTITRMDGGKLMVLMSTEPDVVGEPPGKLLTWSNDNGSTWSKPVSQPLLRGGGAVQLPDGRWIILPFSLTVHKDGSVASPYPMILPDKEEVRLDEGELTVTGWPRPMPEHAVGTMADFRFNRQAIPLPGGGYVGTMYGRFKGDSRASLLCVHSADGLHWTIRGIVAGAACKLPGREGPNEAAICRLKDGRLMSIFRLDSSAMFGQASSSDDGKTWTEPSGMNDVFSVCPYLLVSADGVVVLSAGRPGLYLWINIDGTGKDWQKIDLADVHNTCELTEAIGGPHTTAYTQMQWIDNTHLLYVYDRVPFGWGTIPASSTETNSIWVFRITIEKSQQQK
jgi:hypothetical protein